MSNEFRDSHGYTLEEYPHPNVAVDTVALTYDMNQGLLVLEVADSDGEWALPGTFLHRGEVLADAVQRSLRSKAGVWGLNPRQLHVFDGLNRDNRGWVLSVAHVSVVQPHVLSERLADTTELMPVAAPGVLPYDHNEMIERAVADLRARYEEVPDPDHLLEDEFTLRQLRQVHEAVRGEPIGPDKLDTFRRTMKAGLDPVEGAFDTADGRGRPAQLFRRKGSD